VGLEQTAALAAMLHSVGAAQKRKVPPRPVHPMRIEEEYAGAILRLVHRSGDVYAELRSAMPRLLSHAAADFARHDAGELDIARRLLNEAKDKLGRVVSPDDAAKLAALYGNRTSIAQRTQLAKELKASLGVDVSIDESRTRSLMQLFTAENAQQIGSIPVRQHEDIANLTMRAFTKRMSPETFAEEIRKIADVSEGKARQIARDQIGTLNGQLTEQRQRDLGIVAYFWRTRRDQFVRPEHRRREGVRFEWDNPPKDGHPGIPFGCRCAAESDLSGVLEAIARMKAHARPVR
jgi:SPP1 gp7 family putative phage head morphogenesis protein